MDNIETTGASSLHSLSRDRGGRGPCSSPGQWGAQDAPPVLDALVSHPGFQPPPSAEPARAFMAPAAFGQEEQEAAAADISSQPMREDKAFRIQR